MNPDELPDFEYHPHMDVMRTIYDGRELRPLANREGANDLLAKPSRFGDTLRYRDGTVGEVKR